jgi:hypothetical protein
MRALLGPGFTILAVQLRQLKLRRGRADLVLGMVENRLRAGPLAATVGAALLALSVFQPWYAVRLTPAGASSARQTLDNVALQYGNVAFQDRVHSLGSGFSALAGRQLATLSAEQTLHHIHIVLLILAACAFVAALLLLVDAYQTGRASGDRIALLGLAATLCVLFRMVARPVVQEEMLSLSLAWGVWLALASSLAIVAGGLISRDDGSASHSEAALAKAWDSFSGWTPET